MVSQCRSRRSTGSTVGCVQDNRVPGACNGVRRGHVLSVGDPLTCRSRSRGRRVVPVTYRTRSGSVGLGTCRGHRGKTRLGPERTHVTQGAPDHN